MTKAHPKVDREDPSCIVALVLLSVSFSRPNHGMCVFSLLSVRGSNMFLVPFLGTIRKLARPSVVYCHVILPFYETSYRPARGLSTLLMYNTALNCSQCPTAIPSNQKDPSLTRRSCKHVSMHLWGPRFVGKVSPRRFWSWQIQPPAIHSNPVYT